mgnify:CR=1 FL=1
MLTLTFARLPDLFGPHRVDESGGGRGLVIYGSVVKYELERLILKKCA